MQPHDDRLKMPSLFDPLFYGALAVFNIIMQMIVIILHGSFSFAPILVTLMSFSVLAMSKTSYQKRIERRAEVRRLRYEVWLGKQVQPMPTETVTWREFEDEVARVLAKAEDPFMVTINPDQIRQNVIDYRERQARRARTLKGRPHPDSLAAYEDGGVNPFKRKPNRLDRLP